MKYRVILAAIIAAMLIALPSVAPSQGGNDDPSRRSSVGAIQPGGETNKPAESGASDASKLTQDRKIKVTWPNGNPNPDCDRHVEQQTPTSGGSNVSQRVDLHVNLYNMRNRNAGRTAASTGAHHHKGYGSRHRQGPPRAPATLKVTIPPVKVDVTVRQKSDAYKHHKKECATLIPAAYHSGPWWPDWFWPGLAWLVLGALFLLLLALFLSLLNGLRNGGHCGEDDEPDDERDGREDDSYNRARHTPWYVRWFSWGGGRREPEPTPKPKPIPEPIPEPEPEPDLVNAAGGEAFGVPQDEARVSCRFDGTIVSISKSIKLNGNWHWAKAGENIDIAAKIGQLLRFGIAVENLDRYGCPTDSILIRDELLTVSRLPYEVVWGAIYVGRQMLRELKEEELQELTSGELFKLKRYIDKIPVGEPIGFIYDVRVISGQPGLRFHQRFADSESDDISSEFKLDDILAQRKAQAETMADAKTKVKTEEPVKVEVETEEPEVETEEEEEAEETDEEREARMRAELEGEDEEE